MQRGGLRWWEEASLALGIWLFALLTLWQCQRPRSARLGRDPLHLYTL